MNEGITIQTARKIKLREKLKEFLGNIDEDLRYFCKEVRKDLRDERDYVIAITGYAGVGKSQLGAILGLLIDFEYEFDMNICFIPTSKEIEKTYMSLPMYSYLHIDEASRGLHKQKWYDKIQQKLNELYDSISKDNEIVFYDKNELNRMTIEQMYNKYGENPKNLQIFVIDDNFNVLLKPLDKILQRPIREQKKRMFRIKTRFNKQTIVTEDHSLFVFKNRGEKIVEKSPMELKIGDKLILPKVFPLIENINEDNDFMQLCGAWLADGNYREKNSIQLSGHEHKDLILRISRKFLNRTKSFPSLYNNFDYVFSNRKLVNKMISKGLVGKSCTKRVPSWVFNTNKENKIAFLKGYFTGDGHINFEGRAIVSSVNKELLRDIQLILQSLGLPSSWYFEKAKNSRFKEKVYLSKECYHLSIPTKFHEDYIKFFESTKKNYNLLLNFNPSKGKMDNKRHDRYIKNQCVCTAITEIQEVENYSGYVYDLSVEGIHRFVSNDILHKNTEREGHFLCTALVMPRFQNFAENFRNFRIKYWINIIDRGFAVIYKKDEDKDAKDPWHIDESYKLKLKQWRGKKVYERDLPSVLRMEQKTPNYWFYFRIPEMPKEIWMEYQRLKAESRNRGVEVDVSVEDYRDKLEREKMDRWVKIKEMKINGYKNNEIAAVIGCSSETIRRHLRSMEGYEKIRGEIKTTLQHSTNKINNIYNLNESDKIKKIPTEFDKM